MIRTDVVTVATDTFAPVASFYASSPAVNQLMLHGGDTAASNYNTPFGRSQGLLWNWSGPNAFSSTVQNPVTNNTSGIYQLILTEMRNGCADTVTNTISFAILSMNVAQRERQVNAAQSIVLAGTNSATPQLIVTTKETVTTKVMVYNLAGQTVYTKQVVLQAGKNNIELPASGIKGKLHIVSVFINNRLQFSGKAIL